MSDVSRRKQLLAWQHKHKKEQTLPREQREIFGMSPEGVYRMMARRFENAMDYMDTDLLDKWRARLHHKNRIIHTMQLRLYSEGKPTVTRAIKPQETSRFHRLRRDVQDMKYAARIRQEQQEAGDLSRLSFKDLQTTIEGVQQES